jgi:hypothetical protein
MLLLVGCNQPEYEGGRSVGSSELSLDLTIGSLDDGHTALTPVGAVLLDRRGRLYVQQAQDPGFRVFGSRGEFLQTIGRRGDGPGEFRSMNAVGWQGDALYVIDNTLSRVTLFSQDGEVLDDFPLKLRGGGRAGFPTPWGLWADGRVVFRTQPARQSEGQAHVSHTILFDRLGQVADTIVSTVWPNLTFSAAGSSGPFTANQPFSSRSAFALAPDGKSLVLIEWDPDDESPNPEFQVRRWAVPATGNFHRSFAFEPHPIPATVIDSVVERLASRTIEGRGPLFRNPVAGARVVRRSIYIPRYSPPVTYITIGMDGTIWLRMGEVDDEGRAQWRVLSGAGDSLRTIYLPAEHRVVAADGRFLVVLARGEFDEPYVLRYLLSDLSDA